ncbi:hypothetical protein ACQKE4_19345 [Halomonas sp. NPDC076908]|uniref:hypothetical protein n=1 Tax=Halomonas sp. NPDC076908 TaxID=3390567 RepID=UPI00074B1E94|nr:MULTISPECIES: hypothetical protein [unclassified Halomonas]KUJ87407.1 MAG: hypothetical protein XD36_2115 [Halomonas sp. 54_146]HAA45464.1 hypothetical protein [Halomonas sp.]
MHTQTYQLSLTTQGPLYPPSEVMDENGNFIVIGAISHPNSAGGCKTQWGCAIVSQNSAIPPFGGMAPYDIVESFDDYLPKHLAGKVLHTLPLPLPCTNYPMLFAPEQYPDANSESRPSYAFHKVPIPDLKPEHGRQLQQPVTLEDWMRARGELTVEIVDNGRAGRFTFLLEGLIPCSLYTIMSLRQHDLDPAGPTRPGPLGVPNVFVTDHQGSAQYDVILPNPFPSPNIAGANRIVNVVVLWMSDQMSHGGAIGRYGLGGDIHAQLKFRKPMFDELITQA